MRFFSRKTVVFAAALAAFSVSGCSREPEGPDYVLTYAENQPEDYATTLGAYEFARLVEAETDGRIVIRVVSDGELGDEEEIWKQLKLGGIDFARMSLSPLVDDLPKLNVLFLPYLYRDDTHMWAVLDGEMGEEFLAEFEGSGGKALSWYDGGARNFYTVHGPVRSPEDLEGLRIRIQSSEMMEDLVEALGAVKGMRIRVQESSLMEDVIRALGATPVPIAFEDVYRALQIHQVDGAENNWSSFESSGHYRVAGYYTVDEHSRVPEVQLVSESAWEKLSAKDREILLRCAKESAAYEREMWKRQQEEAERAVWESGCTVIELSAEEKEAFYRCVEPVYDKYCAEYMDIVEKIRKIGEHEREE